MGESILKIFYGSKFIEKEKLEEAGINYPIKVEYYKMINEDEIIHKNNPKFGIKVIKTEYQKEEVKSEEKEIKFLSNDEKQVKSFCILSVFCIIPEEIHGYFSQ